MKYFLPFNKMFEYLTYKNVNHIKKTFSKNKFNHSSRVASLVKSLSDDEDLYASALFHDYLERGGVKDKMKEILTPYSVKLVKALTNKNDTDTLEKMKSVFLEKSPSMINDLVIIKICDRIDNLNKRAEKGEINSGYIRKSVELLQFLYNSYHNDDKFILKAFLIDKLHDIDNNILEELVL